MKKNEQYNNTNLLLFNAAISLILSKENINFSIDELCNNAKLHRQTFYKHYETKDDFIKALLDVEVFNLFHNVNSLDDFFNTIRLDSNNYLSVVFKDANYEAYFVRKCVLRFKDIIKKDIDDLSLSFIIGGIITSLLYIAENDLSVARLRKLVDDFLGVIL